MRRFSKPLFTEESREFVLDLGDSCDVFGPSYGNRIANKKVLRERWGRVSDSMCGSTTAGSCALENPA